MVVGYQPYAPAAFTHRKNSWYSFLLEAESTPGPYCDRKDFMSMKNPLTPAGIEPATFPFVAQHQLKMCTHHNIFPYVYNFCSRPCAGCLSVSSLSVYIIQFFFNRKCSISVYKIVGRSVFPLYLFLTAIFIRP